MPWLPKDDAPSIVVLDSGAVSLLLSAWPSIQWMAPTLVGRVLEMGAFCAAGPPYVPPVTMADVVWVGQPPADGRPHTLLTVVRAIADQEAFAKYCEFPGQQCQLLDRVGNWNWASTEAMGKPISGVADITYQVTGLVGGATGASVGLYACTNAAGAGAVLLDETVAQPMGLVIHENISLAAGGTYLKFGGVPTPGGAGQNATVSCCVNSALAYVPPAEDTDPNIVLPDGTGSTVDQLEVKLDFLQLELRALAGPAFALDPLTTSGTNETVTGELLDAVGLLVVIVDRPEARSTWGDNPDRFPRMAQLTLGNDDGWWPHVDLEHMENVVQPLPPGATRFSVQCEPPMQAVVSLYRPSQG